MQFYSDSFYYHATLHQSDRPLPCLLMLHGFLGSEKVFDHLIEDLKSFCNPITIDLAGHGKTESPSDPKFYTAGRQIRQLTSIIRRLKFDRLCLYGYSMGGRLAFQMLASHPDLFSGAVIESSHCGIESEDEKVSRRNLDEKRARQIETDFKNFIEDWNELSLFQHTPPKLKSVYEDIMKQQNPANMAASLRGFGAGVMPAVCDQVKKIKLPLTLIAGELDQKYVEKLTGLKDKFQSARLHIVKEAGHRVHTDQPVELIDILRNAMV